MAVRHVRVKVGDRWFAVEVEQPLGSPAKVTVDGEVYLVELDRAGSSQMDATSVGQPYSAPPGLVPSSAETLSGPASGLITSPMAGKVLAIRVKPNDKVAAGDEVCVVEAMKMEQSIRAPRSGTVKEVYVTPMQQVNINSQLVELD